MDQARDGDEIDIMKRKLKEVVAGKKRIQNPGTKKVRLGEKSELFSKQEFSLASARAGDSSDSDPLSDDI